MLDLIKSKISVGTIENRTGILLWLLFWLVSHKVSVWIIHSLSLVKFQFFFPLRCPLKTILGLRCPTCGLGESILYFLTGDLSSAFKAHFLGPPIVVLLTAISLFVALYPSSLFSAKPARTLDARSETIPS